MSAYYEQARELAFRLTQWSKQLDTEERRFVVWSVGLLWALGETKNHVTRVEPLSREVNLAYWTATISGQPAGTFQLHLGADPAFDVCNF
jgi:hypothetical protein